MDIKEKVKDAKPLTEGHIIHLLSKGRGANPGELASLVAMLMNGDKPKDPVPAPAAKPKPKVKAKNAEPATQVEPPPEDD